MFLGCRSPEIIHHIFSHHFVFLKHFYVSRIQLFECFRWKVLKRFFFVDFFSPTSGADLRHFGGKVLFYLLFFIWPLECRSLKTMTKEQTRNSTWAHTNGRTIFYRFLPLRFFPWFLWRKLPLPRNLRDVAAKDCLPYRLHEIDKSLGDLSEQTKLK